MYDCLMIGAVQKQETSQGGAADEIEETPP